MKFSLVAAQLAVCRLVPDGPIPAWATAGEWWTVTRAGSELSIVCEARLVPPGVVSSGPWRLLAVEGPLSHALVGIMAAISAALAAVDIPIFAISTYDTDLVLVPANLLDQAQTALRAAGHRILDLTARPEMDLPPP